MSGELCLRNRQRTRAVQMRLLRRLIRDLLDQLLEVKDFDLAVHLVNAREMARLNENHLQHEGSTDVITLDYSDASAINPITRSAAVSKPNGSENASMLRLGTAALRQKGTRLSERTRRGPRIAVSKSLAGEIFVCMDEAVVQARQFQTSWPAELARYIIHGVLHLQGHDDARPAARRRMKRQEGRLLKKLDRRFHLRKLDRKPRLTV